MSDSSRSSYNNPEFKPFQSGSTLCYPSKDYANFKGGSNTLISSKPGKNFYKPQNFKVSKEILTKNTLGNSYATSAGGAKKKKSTKKKGGSVLRPQPLGNDSQLGTEIFRFGACGPANVTSNKPVQNSTMSGGKKRKQTKRKTLKGGQESEESMSLKIPSEESMTMGETMTGGKKRKQTKRKTLKGGQESEESMSLKIPSEESMTMGETMTGGKKRKQTKRKTLKGGQYTPSLGEESMPMEETMSGGKKRKQTKRKNMKGGQETKGATGMPSNYYSGLPADGYAANNGNGVETAYGVIDAKDAGVGNLAPYNTSKNASKLTMNKTGGKKKSSKQSKSKKGGLIPKMSDRPFRLVDNVVNTGAGSLKGFLKQLERNYDKSLVKIQQTRNGLNRLSQGGAKKKSTQSKQKKSLKGGDGSDFASTLNSRGPSNAPDNHQGVDGEKWYRQFNKTGQYIPNSQLSKAAAPKFTGGPKVTKVMGFDTFESTFAPISGGKKTMKKKAVVKKPVKKTITKKKSTTKKPVKKTTTKKSATKKPVKKTTTKKKSTTKKPVKKTKK